MSIADNVAAVPSRVVSTFEYMNSLGEKGALMNDIIAKLEPSGLKKIADGKTSEIKKVIDEMIKMKLLEKEGDKIKTIKEYLNSSSTREELRGSLHNVLFKKLTNKNEAKDNEQEDVPFYIAVILSLDPSKPVYLQGDEFIDMRDELLKEMFEPLTSSKVVNKQQVSNLGYWLDYLGFVSKGFKDKPERKAHERPVYAYPDPTEATAKILPSIFTSTTKLHIEEFQKLLGELIPVLEGGDVRGIIENNTKDDNRRRDNYFSKSTSHALRRLVKRGLINFPPSPSDHSKNWYLDLGKDMQPIKVTNIEYKKEVNA